MKDLEAPPMKRKRQQRSIDTRLKIVNAALSEFAKFGFDGSSTRGISQAADVLHSLVIHHYRTKEDLWHATVREAVSWYVDRVYLPGAEGDATAADRLKHYFREYIRFSADHPDFFRMITQENTLRSERLSWLVDNHVRETTARTAELIAAAQDEGAFVAGDPLQLLYIFVGAATAPYRSSGELELLTGRGVGDPDQVEEHVRTCERLFFRGPAQAA